MENEQNTTQNENENQEDSHKEESPKWLPARLARERKKAVTDIVKQLGFESLEDLSTFIAKEEKPEVNENKPDKKEEKVTTNDTQRLTELENQIKVLEKNIQEKEQLANKSKVESKIVEKVAKEAEFPSDIVSRVFENTPFKDFIKENGELDISKIDEAIGKVRTERPNYFKKPSVGSKPNTNNVLDINDTEVKEKIATTTNALHRAF